MTATDQLRAAIRDLEAKAREMELDKKIETFADQADHFLRVAATRAADLAAENRERIDASLAKAGSAVDSRTDGKYAEYVGKVRSGLMTGVDWVAEQREAGPAGPEPTTTTPTADAGADPVDEAPASHGVTDEGMPSEGSWAQATDSEPPSRPSDS